MSRASAQRNRTAARNIIPLPEQRRAGLSPRAYQARLDLCRLWDLVCLQKPQSEIAQEMGKDPAWVSRSIKRIQTDFSTLFATPTENQLITENLARFESLYAEALKTAFASHGHSRISGLRLAAEILRQVSEYQVTVGHVANRRTEPSEKRGPTLEEVRDEISDEDLNAVFATVARANGWRRPEDTEASA